MGLGEETLGKVGRQTFFWGEEGGGEVGDKNFFVGPEGPNPEGGGNLARGGRGVSRGNTTWSMHVTPLKRKAPEEVGQTVVFSFGLPPLTRLWLAKKPERVAGPAGPPRMELVGGRE